MIGELVIFIFRFSFLLMFLFGSFAHADEVVNIYTSRHYESDKILYKKFENKTGIKVNYISGKGKALFERIKSEGKNSPADIFITVDAANLWKVESEGFFQRIKSRKISKILERRFIGPDYKWIGIAKRYRIIVFNENVKEHELKDINYEDLASDKWKNRIVIRSSSNIYNQSLIASMISHNGSSYMKKWLPGFIENFARKPQGNDRAQVMAVANGEGDIAIVNSYYLGIMLSGNSGESQLNAAKKVKVVFPNQNNRGVHVNISGAGILKYSKNYDNAVKFIEFLLEPEVQKHIVNNTFEYPIVEGVDPHPLIKELGINIIEDTIKVKKLGKLNKSAVKLMDISGWR